MEMKESLGKEKEEKISFKNKKTWVHNFPYRIVIKLLFDF